MVCARSQQRGAILFIDLDDFKTLNDTQGHDVGDQLLQQVAQRLLTCVRAGDTVARLGGDEFVVMLEDLSAKFAGSRQPRPRSSARRSSPPWRRPTSSPATNITAPGASAACSSAISAETVDDLLKRADLAMYRAKAAGRNTLRFFDPRMQVAVTARAVLEAELRKGVREGQFVLHYQPQVDGEGRVTGAEALVRWQHPRRGLVSSRRVHSLAEETGLIEPLGRWVLESACAQLVAWSARPETAHLTLSMNVSAREFRRPEFVARALAAIDRYRCRIRGSSCWSSPKARCWTTWRRPSPKMTALKAMAGRLLAGRLRHRLLLALLPEAPAARPAEDRPVLRARRTSPIPTMPPSPGRIMALGAKLGSGRHCRGRGNRGAAGLLPAGLLRLPGLSVRPAGTR